MSPVVSALRESVVVHTPSERSYRPPDWLSDAYVEPAGFWTRYARELVAAVPGVTRSAVFEWYDLFYEFAERHAGSNRSAFREYSPASGFRDVSYDVLVERAKLLASTWSAHGVTPGTTVCIVVEVNPTYIIGLLAAWYCGATISLIPPEGESFVHWALGVVGADPKPKAKGPCDVFILAGSKARPWVMSFGETCLLPPECKRAVRPAQFANRFAAKDVAARFFSPLGDAWDEPVALSAEQLYLSLIRDGVLLMQLTPGESVAAPGFSELQFKPALLLMTFACGGTWVEVGMEELGDGRALLEGKLDVLGVTPKVRALLLSNRCLRKAKLRRWFRNVAEDSDVSSWVQFTEALSALGIPTMNYFANIAAGGSLLFSAWALRFSGTEVWRSPGLPCALVEPNGTEMPPLADVAMLVPAKFPKGTPGIQAGLPAHALGRLVLALSQTSERLIKNLGSHRAGMVLPEGQIEDVLKREYPDWVRCAILTSLPTHSGYARELVALLVFVQPSERGRASRPLEVFLNQALGQERCPDRVEVFELNPKLSDPKSEPERVDRFACRAQYISGSLWGKSHSPVFRELAALFAEVMAVRGASALAASERKG